MQKSVWAMVVLMAMACKEKAKSVVADATIEEKRPNIILIVTDDLGYSDVGFNSSKDIATPALDELAHTYCLSLVSVP